MIVGGLILQAVENNCLTLRIRLLIDSGHNGLWGRLPCHMQVNKGSVPSHNSDVTHIFELYCCFTGNSVNVWDPTAGIVDAQALGY